MSISVVQLKEMFDRGIQQGARWMIVICNEYALYADNEKDYIEKRKSFLGSDDMVETYDLKMSFKSQSGAPDPSKPWHAVPVKNGPEKMKKVKK